jgi:hypothetical protein
MLYTARRRTMPDPEANSWRSSMVAAFVRAVVLVAAALAAPVHAQSPRVVANPAPNSPSGSSAPVQPALASLVAPRAPELLAAGVQTITARIGKQRRDIQVQTRYGPVYFGWPKNVTPVAFEIQVGSPADVVVRAAGYADANKAQYAAAFDAILPRAARESAEVKWRAERPK